MNPIGLGLDGLLAALLVSALVMGARLNGRLKALRDSQAHFVKAVADLDQAAARAESGLAALRAASEGAHDDLLARIETARGLAQKLERLSREAERTLAAAPALPPSPPTSGRALAAVAALAQRISPATSAEAADPPRAGASRESSRSGRPPPPTPSRRPSADDELFEPPLGPLRHKDDRR